MMTYSALPSLIADAGIDTALHHTGFVADIPRTFVSRCPTSPMP